MQSFSYAPIHLYVLRYGTFSNIIQYKGGLSEMEFSILYLETGVPIETMFSGLSRKSCRYSLYKYYAANFACKILKYL